MNNEKSDVNEKNIYRHKKNYYFALFFKNWLLVHLLLLIIQTYLIAIFKLEKKEVIFQFKIFWNKIRFYAFFYLY